jgi:hypothetical protein
MLADFLWWPLFNALGKILAFTRWYRYIPSERIKRKPTMGENIRHPIDKSYAPGLHHYSKNMDTIPKSPTSYQRLERWSDLFNGYFSDLASEVRGALLQRVLKIKKKFGKNGVALGHISQKEIFLGQFPAGGVESGGWNMFLTINPNLKEALTIMEFKKDLALKTNIIWRNYKSWRFKSYLKKSASKSLAKSWFTNLMRRYLKPWPINKSAQWYYLRYHWIEILNDATDPKRKVQIEKIVSQFTKKINKLEEKGIQPIMNAKVRAPWRLPLSSEYRMRSTRGNKTMASQFMFAVLSQQLSYRDLRKIAVLKYTADPYDQLKDKDYSESAVHMIDRMQETRHKTQSLQGSAFNISVPTSFREPISQKPINKPRTRMLILHHLKEFERILIPDDVSLYHLLSQGIQAIEFDFSRNHYVERTAEKTYIERKILEAKEKNKNGKPILVIKYLNSETDQHAFNFARKNDFDIIVLTSRQRLNTLKIPGDKNGIRKLGKVRLVDTEEELAQLDKLLPVKKFKFDEAE